MTIMKYTSFLRNLWKTCVSGVLFIVASSQMAQATHLRAGEIIVERVNCNSLTFKITITVYTNTNSTVLFGGEQDELNFGDGTPIQLVPETQNTVRRDLNPDGSVATASFTTYHTYAGPGNYVISYIEPNRNEGVLNMDNSVNTTFYIETSVTIDPFLGCNSSPVLSVPPIDRACPGVLFTHNPGASDPNGDRLTYEMVVPFRDRGTTVSNYRDPNNAGFYSNYNTANEAGNGKPTFSIDGTTGTITWDAPGASGEYNIAFLIIEWRQIGGEWYKMGYVRRDMQIIVEDCKNKRPDLIVPQDTCVEAGSKLVETIYGIDPDHNDVKIEAFSEVFQFANAQSPAKFTPNPPVFQPTTPDSAKLFFEWQTECLHVRQQPYQVVFKVSDKPDPGTGPSLVTFKTWAITVVGPKPIWETATLNAAKRSVALKWKPYVCANAQSMQVWRKVDGTDFDPDNCQTGMPDLGYTLITTVPIGTTTFNDTNNGNGLAPGAKYCYRLVAEFPQPNGGESYVSEDICVGPILADVPIITNVTVDTTDVSKGRVTVRWRRPYEANPAQFPQPYTYKVYRAVGFTRGTDSTLVGTVVDTNTGLASDTTFIDRNINTEENIYNYSISAYSPAVGGGDPPYLGASAPASTVRLSTNSQVKKILLTWQAEVPWSNRIQTVPNKHLIFRGAENAPEQDLVLIDSVDANAGGFSYTDEGQHGELVDGQTYCYRIMTRGGYGNPHIREPLENYSQIICAQPGDTIPPCKPGPPERSTADYIDCDDYFSKYCSRDNYRNVIFWNRPENAACRADIASFNVYAASTRGDSVFLLATNVRDTFYIDSNLASYARCYKIAAVDRSGNVGPLSDELCIDNCPYYELPNVFTPNTDGYNDLFSAYSIREYESCEECVVPELLRLKCARFVQSVHFKVYNRWGQEVYTYTGKVGNEVNNIYIDWNGRDKGGSELTPAVYYYIAEVTFDSVDPASRVKTFKGWVHLIR